MRKEYFVSDMLLLMYKNAETSVEQTVYVAQALQHDAELQAKYLALVREDEAKLSPGRDLPMERMAAASEDNLCDVLCEEFILRNFSISEETEALLSSRERNKWMKEDGTPLYNMGRILEANGMTVTRRYDCCFQDILDALSSKIRVIAVVDYGLLTEGTENGVFHAIVCVSATPYLMRVFDPAVGEIVDVTVQDFEQAWNCSRNYLVSATTENLEYNPQPIDLSDVELDEDLLELTEIIAENTHEVWGYARKQEGWRYGVEKSVEHKTNPDMVPYCDLPEIEKDYDRRMALMTLKLAKKLGFRVSRYGKNSCKHCGGSISVDMLYCPNCGEKLEWEDFF